MTNGLGGNMFSGFLAKPMGLSNAIGQGIGAWGQAQQQKQERHAELQAADLLQQSLKTAQSDPEGSQAAFIQAMQMAPDFVNNVLGGLKKQQAGQAKPMSEYQRESLDLRRQQQELDRLKMEQSKETNELRREQIQAQINKIESDVESKKTEATQKEEQAADQVDETINLLDRMIKHPGRESATGFSSLFSGIPGTEGRGFRALLDTLKGQQFLNEVQALKGMGQLSNAEGDKLAAAAASLDISMPEDEFLAELQRIKTGLETARKTKKGTYNNAQSQSGGAPQAALDYLNANPQMIEQFEAKYGYRPEGF